MKSGTKNPQKRALQYLYSDGIVELAFGLVCVLVGLYLLALALLPEGSLAFRLLNISSVFIALGIAFLGRRVPELIKRRITYPRTGYIAYRRPGKLEYFLTWLVGFLIFALGTGLLALPRTNLSWMPGVGGIIFGAVILFQAMRLSLTRFLVLALISLLIGGGLALSRVQNLLGLAYFFLATGPFFFVSGLIVLRRYLRSTQVETEGSV